MAWSAARDTMMKTSADPDARRVLGTLNSKRWHESVFSWMTKYLDVNTKLVP